MSNEKSKIISKDELACYYITKYVLKTHKELNDEDVNFGVNFITSFYKYSLETLKKQKIQGLLNDDQLVMFLTYANQNGITRFSLTFNEELESALKSRDTIILKKIILGPKEMFVELYDNKYLSDSDRISILRLLSREIIAMNDLFRKLKEETFNIQDVCSSKNFYISINKNQSGIDIATLSSECYINSCIQDLKLTSDDEIYNLMRVFEKPSKNVFIIEKELDRYEKYCLDTLEIIKIVDSENPINPLTNKPLSENIIKLIKQKFHKEIALYKRYKEKS